MLIDLHEFLEQDMVTCRSFLALAQEVRTPHPGPRGSIHGKWTRSGEMKDESWSIVKGMGSSGPPFPRQGVEVLLFSRGPNAIIGCSHPDLWLGLGDSMMGSKFLCLL